MAVLKNFGPRAHAQFCRSEASKHSLGFGFSFVQPQTCDLGPGAEEAKLIARAKVNVFHSKFSEPLRDLVRKGNLEIQGGIYHLETGRVEFLGRSPQQAQLLSSKRSIPPPLPAAT